MLATDQQIRRLRQEITKTGLIGLSALKAGIDRKTARKYMSINKLPSETVKPRDWRTRENPFEDVWSRVETRLEDAPTLEAKVLFGWLCKEYPGKFQEGQLRTFQRRVRDWRALNGPPKEVFFAQEHRPGEALQTDHTDCNVLEVTIAGEPFDHKLCHSVLPYSNWEWATVCLTESFRTLRNGTQSAVFELGYIPSHHQVDSTTAASHWEKDDEGKKKREFNDNYKSLMRHLSMKPRRIGVGKCEQNGDVEAIHNALKKALNQHLLLRGSRDFETIGDYEKFVQAIVRQRNSLRTKRLHEELAVMRPLNIKRLPEYTERIARVTSWSTVRVNKRIYSVPSRLIGENLKVRIYDDMVEFYFKDIFQQTAPYSAESSGHCINYRHIIWSLVRKPGAFERYKYRETLFPTIVFRQAYDVLCEHLDSQRKADINYLRILHLAASTMEIEVETALELILEEKLVPRIETVKELVSPHQTTAPDVEVEDVDLAAEYGDLLEEAYL